ncbi:hypothetical protein BCR34DRAFT_87406 [Clohesyomyces aquaticus]|uniref:DUF6536 domain-containing protein n=1 Tax=Clohesyomyces aquaticus TaxID=1231657 RepID=A0A1Y2A2Y6_9PLEO|nr:hypothetical protein BCR34DRAFT_87406 [Clohesyomyces aquaticus]
MSFPYSTPEEPARARRRDRLLGSSWAVAAFASAAFVVFTLNLACSVWAILRFPPKHDIGTVYDGDCQVSARIVLWIHVARNAMSAVLLSGSSYCMQRLMVPSRYHIDKAHANGIWLDIGIPSIRNLRVVGYTNVLLYFLLALSSVPLHFLVSQPTNTTSPT